MDLAKIDRKLVFVNKRAQPSNPNPINFENEKERVFRDKAYNPQFKYDGFRTDLITAETILKKLKADKSVFGILLNQKINEFTNQINLIKNYGKEDFTKYSIKLYGKPSEELIKRAKAILRLESEDEFAYLNTMSAIKKFVDVMKEYNLKYTVIEKDMIVAANFDIAHKMMYINKNRRYSENEIRRLIVHEIKTHIIRSENGKKQRYKLFVIGFPNYLSTEEGLAVYNEERFGFLNNGLLKRYAGRVVAVNMALKNSFSFIYNYLLDYFGKEQAFTLATRAKRGLSDTSKPGAYTKDYLYLEGYYKIKDFVNKGNDINKLYIGKIGLEHVDLIRYI